MRGFLRGKRSCRLSQSMLVRTPPKRMMRSKEDNCRAHSVVLEPSLSGIRVIG
jgi:hypothetical protein